MSHLFSRSFLFLLALVAWLIAFADFDGRLTEDGVRAAYGGETLQKKCEDMNKKIEQMTKKYGSEPEFAETLKNMKDALENGYKALEAYDNTLVPLPPSCHLLTFIPEKQEQGRRRQEGEEAQGRDRSDIESKDQGKSLALIPSTDSNLLTGVNHQQ